MSLYFSYNPRNKIKFKEKVHYVYKFLTKDFVINVNGQLEPSRFRLIRAVLFSLENTQKLIAYAQRNIKK